MSHEYLQLFVFKLPFVTYVYFSALSLLEAPFLDITVQQSDLESCRGLVVMSCDSHRWTTGRASGPKMLTAPAKSQLTIGHRPSLVKTGSV